MFEGLSKEKRETFKYVCVRNIVIDICVYMCTCVFFLTDAPLLNGSTHRTPVRKILSYIQRTTELLKTKKHSCQDPSQITSSPHDMFIPTPKYLCKTSWVPRGLRISEKSFFIDELTITDIGWPAKNMSQFSKREKKKVFLMYWLLPYLALKRIWWGQGILREL